MNADDLDNMLGAMDEDSLSDDQKEELKESAIEKFNDIEGVEFDDITKLNTSDALESDFNITRKVLIKNIDRTEKITSLIMDEIALGSLPMVALVKDILDGQNKNLKLLSELQNKILSNKALADKLDKEDKDNKPTLPPGFE